MGFAHGETSSVSSVISLSCSSFLSIARTSSSSRRCLVIRRISTRIRTNSVSAPLIKARQSRRSRCTSAAVRISSTIVGLHSLAQPNRNHLTQARIIPSPMVRCFSRERSRDVSLFLFGAEPVDSAYQAAGMLPGNSYQIPTQGRQKISAPLMAGRFRSQDKEQASGPRKRSVYAEHPFSRASGKAHTSSRSFSRLSFQASQTLLLLCDPLTLKHQLG